MRYLKLFEGFSEDFYNELKSLEDKYKSDKEELVKRLSGRRVCRKSTNYL